MNEAPKLPVMTPVQSSHLAEVGHDGAALYVRFRGHDGKPDPHIYRHPGVPQEHAAEILRAKSPGSYYHQAVRAARYPAEKIA